VAGLTFVGALEVLILSLREENMTGGDQEKLVEACDRNEKPSGPFGPRSVFRTDGNAEGGGEGLAKDCRGVDDVGGPKEPGTNHLNDGAARRQHP
jgi:hypothetical protein